MSVQIPAKIKDPAFWARNEALQKLVTRKKGDREGILASLKEYGICVVHDYMSAEVADRVRNACIERAEVPGDVDFPDGSYRRYDTYQGTGAAANKRVYHVDCFSKEAEEFRHDADLKWIAKQYMGVPQSVHVLIYERHSHHQVPVRGFHVDTFECPTFKAFMYLSDVDPSQGPTSYIVGTHRDAELRRLKREVWGPKVSDGDPSGKPHPTNFTDEELGPLLEKHCMILGKRGTLVLFDTWGVHKGTTPDETGDRHVMVNYYREGENLPRSNFGYDAKADYQRYAVDFDKHLSKGEM